MIEEEKKKESGEISRREFLKDAGLVVGGAAIGSTVLLAACGEGEVTTETVTTTVTETVSKYVCPIDGMEFDTLAALQAHFAAEHPAEAVEVPGLVTLIVNGETHVLWVQPNWTLADVLREKLGLTGTKVGCNEGTCGACTVAVDGKLYYSCTTLAIECDGRNIETIESFVDDPEKRQILDMFVERGAVQCGFCVPGTIVATKLLLDKIPKPTEAQIKEGLSGNLCRCGIYAAAEEAILALTGGN